MSHPLVSVIMSVYNGQRYLNESIDSVLNQEFNDFEFLIYDDGSTDNTAQIVQSKNDPRIKFLPCQTNQGLFPALNKIIAQATGRYIRLWSYDDIMKPHCLATEINFYQRNPGIGFCYCNREDINELGRFIPNREIDETPAIIPQELATQLMFYWGCLPGNISAVMIKKEILEKTGGFDNNLCQSADFDLWERIAQNYPIGFIREPLVSIRHHSGQFSRWKNMSLVSMKENRRIFERLLKRMPGELIPYAKDFHRRYVYVQYFNTLVSNLIGGHLDTAAGILAELRKYERIFPLFWMWLFTFGGRKFRPQPKIKEPAGP